MKATFVELPPFERLRDTYFDDESFKNLQNELMDHPTAGVFTVYDKDEADDLTADQGKALKQRLQSEIKARSAPR